MIKCKICGCEFPAVINKHYVAKDNGESGLANIIRNVEGNIYDAFDCPMCGCQVIVQERKRSYITCIEADECEEETENE